MSIAIAKNHMAEMKMLGMLAVLDKTLTEATRDKISYTEFVDTLLQAEADYRGGSGYADLRIAATMPSPELCSSLG